MRSYGIETQCGFPAMNTEQNFDILRKMEGTIMLSEINQTYKDTYHKFIPYIASKFEFRGIYVCVNRT